MEKNEKIIIRSDRPERDWEEDFSHENGNYQCECMDCGNTFFGHKRRVKCKICSNGNLATLTRNRQIAINEGKEKTIIDNFDFAINLIKEYRKTTG